MITKTIAELVVIYNMLAKKQGKQELKGYKGAKEKLIANIASLEMEAIQKAQATNHSPKLAIVTPKAAVKAAMKEAKAVPEAKQSKYMEKKPPVIAPGKLGKADVAPKAEKKQSIGSFCIEQIKLGKTNPDILAMVEQKFPDAKTTGASIAWYRNKVKAGA
jgi:RNA-splicing ligase RtcB